MPPADDPSAAVALLMVRLRACAPAKRPGVVRQLLPFLANPRVPLAVRYAAAGRAVESLPDRPGPVRSVARALTARVPAVRALARLRHLQHLVERCDALDALVARRERKVKLTCPRCQVRLPRADMAKHLWHEHRLTLQDGKVRSRVQLGAAARAEYATASDSALIDQAARLGGEAVLGPWAAETAVADELTPVCAAAGARGAAVCPGCLADVPPPVPPLPPALAVAHGRVAGDGLVAKVPVLSPPRVRATLAAAGAMVVFALVVPVLVAFALSAVAYLLALALLRPRNSPDDRAIDAAWRKHARRLTDRRDAARVLTRLCVTSVGRGDPFERANALNALVERARARSGERQLLAVALALKVDDGGRFGRDRATGVADLVAPAFAGAQPASFAEHVLATYFLAPRDPGELARLRVLLLAEAFAAELTPRQVLDLCDAAPSVARAARLSPNHVALLYGVRANRSARVWEAVGPARTVFDLAANAPTTAARLLAHDPGLVLVCDPDPDAEAELGPVLVSLSGVSVGGATVSDPAAEVRLAAGGRELVFGREVLRVSGRLPDSFPGELKAWLRFRAEVLAGYPAIFLRGEQPAPPRVLKPFVAKCPACGTACLPTPGALARRVGPAPEGGR